MSKIEEAKKSQGITKENFRETVENIQEGYEYKTGSKISFLDAACTLLNIKNYADEVTKQISFLWNGIKVDGKLYQGKLINYPEGTITIYAKDYTHFPLLIREFTVQNDSDCMTDYYVQPSNKYYDEVLKALEKAIKTL